MTTATHKPKTGVPPALGDFFHPVFTSESHLSANLAQETWHDERRSALTSRAHSHTTII